MIVRDLLTVVPSTQIVELHNIDYRRTDRVSSFSEHILEKMKYIDCKVILIRTYIENNQVILRLLVS